MNINQLFLEEFKDLEQTTFKIYKQLIGYSSENRPTINTALTKLAKKGIYPYNKYEDDFAYCRKIRNLFSHRPIDAVIISEYVYNLLKELNKMVKNPLKAIDIAIKKPDLYCRTLEDNIKDTIVIMKNKTYTHIPIIKNKKIIGVFCEKTLVNYISKEKRLALETINCFNNIKNYLNIEDYESTVKIINKNVKINQILTIFKDSFENRENIECLLVTDDGTKNGELLGIITIWDILNKYI